MASKRKRHPHEQAHTPAPLQQGLFGSPDLDKEDQPVDDTATPELRRTQVRHQGFNFGQTSLFANPQPIQRQAELGAETEEAVETETIQMKAAPGLAAATPPDSPVQRQADEQEESEDEAVQMKAEPGRVTRNPSPPLPPAQPIQCQAGEEDSEETAQMKAAPSKHHPLLGPSHHDEESFISLGPKDSGAPLPDGVKAKMEHSFGTDFGDVRVHEGDAAKQINAVAYTQGQDIHFQPGKYNPDSPKGQELLGHELTHVVQQRSGQVAKPQGKGASINADTHLETEADRLGAKAAQGKSVQVQGVGNGIQRAKDEEDDLLGPRAEPINIPDPDQEWADEQARKIEEQRLMRESFPSGPSNYNPLGESSASAITLPDPDQEWADEQARKIEERELMRQSFPSGPYNYSPFGSDTDDAVESASAPTTETATETASAPEPPISRQGPGAMTADESRKWLEKTGFLWTDDDDSKPAPPGTRAPAAAQQSKSPVDSARPAPERPESASASADRISIAEASRALQPPARANASVERTSISQASGALQPPVNSPPVQQPPAPPAPPAPPPVRPPDLVSAVDIATNSGRAGQESIGTAQDLNDPAAAVANIKDVIGGDQAGAGLVTAFKAAYINAHGEGKNDAQQKQVTEDFAQSAGARTLNAFQAGGDILEKGIEAGGALNTLMDGDASNSEKVDAGITVAKDTSGIVGSSAKFSGALGAGGASGGVSAVGAAGADALDFAGKLKSAGGRALGFRKDFGKRGLYQGRKAALGRAFGRGGKEGLGLGVAGAKAVKGAADIAKLTGSKGAAAVSGTVGSNVIPGLQVALGASDIVQSGFKGFRAGRRRGQLTQQMEALQGTGSPEQIAALQHIHEIQEKKQKAAGFKAATGGLGVAAGVLSLTGVGAIPAAALAGAGVGANLTRAGAKKFKQWGRDKAARQGRSKDEIIADRQQKRGQAQAAVTAAQGSRNPFKKFSAWRAGNKLKKYGDASGDAAYADQKQEKYQNTSPFKKGFLDLFNTEKSTDKKEARTDKTADEILNMGSDPETQKVAMDTLGLERKKRDALARKWAEKNGAAFDENYSFDNLPEHAKKDLILGALKKR